MEYIAITYGILYDYNCHSANLQPTVGDTSNRDTITELPNKHLMNIHIFFFYNYSWHISIRFYDTAFEI